MTTSRTRVTGSTVSKMTMQASLIWLSIGESGGVVVIDALFGMGSPLGTLWLFGQSLAGVTLSPVSA